MATEVRSFEEQRRLRDENAEYYTECALMACVMLGLLVGAVLGAWHHSFGGTVEGAFLGFFGGLFTGFCINLLQVVWFYLIRPLPTQP